MTLQKTPEVKDTAAQKLKNKSNVENSVRCVLPVMELESPVNKRKREERKVVNKDVPKLNVAATPISRNDSAISLSSSNFLQAACKIFLFCLIFRQGKVGCSWCNQTKLTWFHSC